MSAQNLYSQRKGDWRVYEKSEGLLDAHHEIKYGFSPAISP